MRVSKIVNNMNAVEKGQMRIVLTSPAGELN